MDNQHKKISGYRDLSQTEIDLMNLVKAKAEEVGALLEEITRLRAANPESVDSGQLVESYRNINLSKDNLQTGFMWLTRAVALPTTF